MSEEEVWVRMMAAILSTDTPARTETVADWADGAVAEWRKRYAKPAEQPPALFKCGDRVLHNERPGVIAGLVSSQHCVVDLSDRQVFADFRELTFDHAPQPPAFKVGDAVTLRGRAATVTEEDGTELTLLFADGGMAVVSATLVAHAPTPAFKVGDRVRFAGDSYTVAGFKDGWIVEIADANGLVQLANPAWLTLDPGGERR